MTTAEFKAHGNTFAVDISGHAGHEDPRVCAGCSMLACTLIEAMRREDGAGNLTALTCETNEASGAVSIRAMSTDYGRKRVQAVMDTIVAGYELLAAMYPENVRIVYGR